MAGLSDAASHSVITIAGRQFQTIDFTLVQQNIFDSVSAEIAKQFSGYRGEVKVRFDRMLISLIRFLSDRADSLSTRHPYLGRVEGKKDAPKEAALQKDLYEWLYGQTIPAELEHPNVAAGRTDIYVNFLQYRFVIEVKRLLDPWTVNAIEPYLSQTTAYQQTCLRLGVLAVLDLSDRPPGYPHIEDCFEVRSVERLHERPRVAVVMRVPGNRATPSTQ